MKPLTDEQIVARYKATIVYKEEAMEKLKMKQKALFQYYELHKDEINEWITDSGFTYHGEICHEQITTNSKL